MTIGFVSNFMNHHQKPVADRLYAALGEGFRWIATTPTDETRIQLGYDDENASVPYVRRTYSGAEEYREAYDFCLSCDCLIVAYEFGDIVRKRMRQNKMTVICSERICKKNVWELLNPREFASTLLHRTRYRHRPLYLLSIGDYAANDYRLTLSFPKKCYRWGYFIDLPPVEPPLFPKDEKEAVSIFWAARFIDWKHPEYMIDAARRMKAEGLPFQIEMAGTGPLFGDVEKQILKAGLQDRVRLLGPLPHEQVREKMRQAPIFCLTSNRREGWGAVVGEALASRCVVVASEAVGAASVLLTDRQNGVLFKNNDCEDFCRGLRDVVASPRAFAPLAENGYETMRGLWNPDVAAERLIVWVSRMLAGEKTPYETGPCSFIR